MTSTALVVGASSEIGRAVAVALARRGYRVEGWGRDASALERTATACAEQGTGGSGWSQVDLTDQGQLTAMVGELLAATRLGVVVWAAGLFDWASATDSDPMTWIELIQVNLVAAANLTSTVAPALVSQAPSALIYVGSTAAHEPFANNAAYVASKHGLRGLAQSTYADLRHHQVKVSLISPGLVAAGAGLTSPVGATTPDLLLQPEDVARAVDFVLDFPSRGCPLEIRMEAHLGR